MTSDSNNASPERCSRPRPSRALVVCSVLVLGECVVLISIANAIAMDTRGPFSIVVAVFFLAAPVTLAVAQYRGTFRRNAEAASTSVALLGLVAYLAGMMFVTSLMGPSTNHAQDIWIAQRVLIPASLVMMINIPAAVLNGIWSVRLRRGTNSVSGSAGLTRNLRRDGLAVVLVATCALAMTPSALRLGGPEYAMNVSAAGVPFGLPRDACDVSYRKGPRRSIKLEFTIDENGFIEWIAQLGRWESREADVSVEQITKPKWMSRCHHITSDPEVRQSVKVTNGLHYGWSSKDRTVEVVFDRSIRRAYYNDLHH